MEYTEPEQVAFYLERAREAGGRALELGCGTGLLSVALALDGIDLVALDPSDALISQAIDRRNALGLTAEKCRFQTADPRGWRGEQPFGLVFAPSDTLRTLPGPADLEQLFANALANLTPDGVFACDLRQATLPGGEQRPQRSAVEHRYQSSRRPHLVARREPGGGSTVHRLKLLDLTIGEVEDALKSAGLREQERWADFQETPWEPDSPRAVIVAGRA